MLNLYLYRGMIYSRFAKFCERINFFSAIYFSTIFPSTMYFFPPYIRGFGISIIWFNINSILAHLVILSRFPCEYKRYVNFFPTSNLNILFSKDQKHSFLYLLFHYYYFSYYLCFNSK